MHRGILALAAAAAGLAADPQGIRLSLRSRVEVFKGSAEWREVSLEQRIEPARAAIVLCDLWDKHWCRGASERVDGLAPKANPLLERVRRRGMLIIHAPSDTMEFYKDAPQRLAILRFPKSPPPPPLALTDPPLPIDDSDGGCDTPDKFYKAWTRQHPAIRIDDRDLISDNGQEIYSALQLRGINALFVMGVHTNMCVLNRSFAILQMTKWGVRCVLIRDLTDAMYDPQDRPYVIHERGTELVIEHIEKYWAPTVLSTELMAALGQG